MIISNPIEIQEGKLAYRARFEEVQRPVRVLGVLGYPADQTASMGARHFNQDRHRFVPEMVYHGKYLLHKQSVWVNVHAQNPNVALRQTPRVFEQTAASLQQTYRSILYAK